MEIEVAGPADADALAAVFTASRLAAMPWLPRLHSAAEDRRFMAERLRRRRAGWVPAHDGH